VVLEVERFKRPWSKRLGTFFDLKPRRKVRLDARGSAVWTLCDGKRTVEEIGEVMDSQFGPDKHQYQRLTELLLILETNGLVEIRAPESPKDGGGGPKRTSKREGPAAGEKVGKGRRTEGSGRR
jgi:hypothetical protein